MSEHAGDPADDLDESPAAGRGGGRASTDILHPREEALLLPMALLHWGRARRRPPRGTNVPLPGFGVAAPFAQVPSVCLETDDPVDDIRIEFVSGAVSYVQAKRTLRKGKPLNAPPA